MEVNYKRQKHYNTAKYPIRQPRFFVGLIWLLSRFVLMGKRWKVEKINMEGLKPPYILLSNHHSFIDFELIAMGTWPHRVNNVVNIDGYYMRSWLMELIGCICTRKFTTDLHLVKSIHRVLKQGDILCMYPEARYSPCGNTSFLPDSIGKLVRMNKVPVVVAIHHGNYLHSPVWNFRQKRRVPLHTTMTQVLTAEQAATMSVSQINEAIRGAMDYDEYRYQKEADFRITEPYRAEGLHKILYHCPHCMTESQMDSKGAELFCTACGKRWTLNEDSSLTAQAGETEFAYIPDWFRWERQQVQQQIDRGEYAFTDEVEVYSLPHSWKYHPLGKATLTHDMEHGLILEGFFNGKLYRIQRTPLQTNSLHVEYEFNRIKPFDCVDISTEKDSFYCYTTKKDVITKLAFATEILYLKHQKK